LLEDANINGARGVLLNIVGGPDLTMHEINEAATLIHNACDPDAEIIFGSVTDEKMAGSVTVTVIATGFTTPSRELDDDNNRNNVEIFPDRQVARPATGRRSESSPRERSAQQRTADPRTQRRENTTAERGSRPADRVISRPGVQPRTESPKRGAPEYRSDDYTELLEDKQPLTQQPASDFDTPEETVKEVLMAPQSYGANNMGFDDENDLDIPTYLRNMKKMKP
jgi:hypothetical protein